MKRVLDWEAYKKKAREVVGEGIVLIQNKNNALPLTSGEKVAVFGRTQLRYYKSGTGSGGMVNVTEVIGILDGLRSYSDVVIDEDLASVYAEWVKQNPYNEGIGWGTEPWSQPEMEVSDELAKEVAARSKTALVLIGRTAGEDQDNQDVEGAYRLMKTEETLLENCCKYFDKVIVVFNTANIMDMSFMDKYPVDAVLYGWQGGMIGGEGTADVLVGRVSPSGKLPDTIAYHVSDYPSDPTFSVDLEDVYEEDIYVGYRYFETVAKEKVRYPFGFGLSYTQFSMETADFAASKNNVTIQVKVTNTGDCSGKEVVQAYLEAPMGLLGKPSRVLVGFAKTGCLQPGESETVSIVCNNRDLASYDDSGVTGYKSAWVMEPGSYVFYIGNNVRETENAGKLEVAELQVLSQLEEALTPIKPFERMKAVKNADGTVQMEKEPAPLRTISMKERRLQNLPAAILMTGNQGYTLKDVKTGKIDVETLVAQFSEDDLSAIIRGEGMGSPKVTSGTASAFGGVSDSLHAYGLPCVCCSDGPSGMRLDCGAKAFSLPIGTMISSTFNTELVRELYRFTGTEMIKNKVDCLLGPGINVHRHPLNGRNFEYFSEDPLLTGKMVAAVLQGMEEVGVTGTVKHFCGNNRERDRRTMNSVISERALREIYLRTFEMAVKEGNATSVMTTYGAVNGLWTASNYDLCTVILREQWGYKGVVMSDWWAMMNEEGGEPSYTNFSAMVRAQNDLYMVCPDGGTNATGENTLDSLKEGVLTIGELQRCAVNTCSFLLNTHAYQNMYEEADEVEVLNAPVDENEVDASDVTYYEAGDEFEYSLEGMNSDKGANIAFGLRFARRGKYAFSITAKSDRGKLAQIPVTVFCNGIPSAVITFSGTGGEWVTVEREADVPSRFQVFRIHFSQNGLEVRSFKIRRTGDLAGW